MFYFFSRTLPHTLIQITNKHTQKKYRDTAVDILHVIVAFCVLGAVISGFNSREVSVHLVCIHFPPPEQIPSLHLYYRRSSAHFLCLSV